MGSITGFFGRGNVNKVEHVEVVRDGELFRWRKTFSHKLPTTSTSAWLEPEAAVQAAERVAESYGCNVLVPSWMYDRLQVVAFADLMPQAVTA